MMKDEFKKPLTVSDCRKLAAVLIATWFFLSVVIVVSINQYEIDYWLRLATATAVNLAIGLFFEIIYREVLRVNGVLRQSKTGNSSEMDCRYTDSRPDLLRVRPMSEREWV